MASWMNFDRDERQWYYRTSVKLEPRVPPILHSSKVNSDVNQVIHKETLYVSCEPKIDGFCQSSLSSDGKIAKTSQIVYYSTKYTSCKYTYVQSDEGRPPVYNNEINVRIPFSEFTEVYHSRAIQIPSLNSQSDVISDGDVSSYSENNTLTDDTVDSPQFSGNPLTMSTPIVCRHLSERNPRIFENDSISYLYEFDSLDSLFSKDSTISGDDVTDYQNPQYKNEVLILGLNSRKKRYAKTTSFLKGILKKRSQ
ncbi:uncharacterized protein LOC132552642 [Ylistrum balloti]|uniref:uncharacterized protein LOC132552642 n=1 Tax=Ylistrum balloti TaxID=509963 RepID=UPI00290593A8|nr:uncharacterized protein LOC132552642 [Ylistrum balloti]